MGYFISPWRLLYFKYTEGLQLSMKAFEPNFGNLSFPIRVIFKEPYAEIFKNFSVVALGIYRLNELIK